MSDDFELTTANTVGLAVEWALYGVSLPLFVMTMKTLLEPLQERRRSSFTRVALNKKAIALATLLLLLCTLVILADLVQSIDDFRDHIRKDHAIAISPSYFTRIRQGPEIIRGVAYMAITLLADAVVAYRCFIIWKSKLVIATIPWILWGALLSTCIGQFCAIGMIKYQSDEELAQITAWATAFFSTSLAANAIGTGLLAFKIWKIDRESSRFRLRDSPLRKLLRVAIDSGLIYTITLSMTLAAFVSKAAWKGVFIHIMPTTICVTFYLMIIRIIHSVREQNEIPDVESVFNHNDVALRRVSIRPSLLEVTMDTRTEISEKRELSVTSEIAVVNRE